MSTISAKRTSQMNVRYSYLLQQFGAIDQILEEFRAFVPTGDFTLGKPLAEFERRFAELIGAKHAIGVASGTDAIKLPLRAVGVGHGDEVITAANTFIATVGAIAELGARPVFVDVDDTFCLDADQIAAAITDGTKAIVPVHLTGYAANMPLVMEIAQKHGVPVVEDACQGILASIAGRNAGTWGVAGAFSLHPLKNLNVWGDGGVIVTDDDELNHRLRLLRNHGLVNRDEVAILGYNSRLDTLQAIVGNWLIGQVPEITRKRIDNAEYYDAHLGQMSHIRIPPRPADQRRVYHLYIVFAEDRDGLYAHCQERGIECKIHYPVPIYQQPGLRDLGYKPGDFPVSDRHAREMITLPTDQHLTRDEQDYVIDCIRSFKPSG